MTYVETYYMFLFFYLNPTGVTGAFLPQFITFYWTLDKGTEPWNKLRGVSAQTINLESKAGVREQSLWDEQGPPFQETQREFKHQEA